VRRENGCQKSEDHASTAASTTMRIIFPFRSVSASVADAVADLLTTRCVGGSSTWRVRLLVCWPLRGVSNTIRSITAWQSQHVEKRTLLYFLMALTNSMNTSSTMIRCLAEVSMHTAPKWRASSIPSAKKPDPHQLKSRAPNLITRHPQTTCSNSPLGPTCLSYSKSHLFATTTTGK
jgi:hypothetical protein